MYDLVFGYRAGDRSRSAFSAGLGVFLAVRMFLDYKGAIFWKMDRRHGRRRLRADAPGPGAVEASSCGTSTGSTPCGSSADGTVLRSVELTRQAPSSDAARLRAAGAGRGTAVLPRPARIDGVGDHRSTEDDPWPGAGEPVSMVVGDDVDEVVLAVSLGALPAVAADIVATHPSWQAMIEHVRTVPTRSAQLWLRDDEVTLGWNKPGATLSGLDAAFDTCASMTHLLPLEGWPVEGAPRSLLYLCSALPEAAPDVAATADAFLHDWSSAVWPGGGPTALADDGIVAHHTSANIDPSDRYVQSLPGSGGHRLRVDGSGVDHLVLAGDWTDCGLNAGCIEAATISGLQAAAAIEGRPLSERVLGPLTWDAP